MTDEGPPVVTAIHIAPATRLPVRSVASVVAEAGKGLVGDRYHGTRHRHVTVQSQQQLDEAAAVAGAPIDPAGTRRNVTISHGEVPTAPGARVRIGGVELEVVRRAAPCKLLDDVIGTGTGTGARTELRGRARSASAFRPAICAPSSAFTARATSRLTPESAVGRRTAAACRARPRC